MFKIFKKSLPFFAIIFSIFMVNVNAFGAEPVYVHINNVPIKYTDALPQIMNQRAMVPIRVTAESLGATLDWNKDTETMTLYKGDRTVVHTMRSRVITVNGKALTFDTPSTVVSDRMMMPIRMLGESLGNVVTWDDASRTVNITATDAQIISAVPDKTTVNSGETVNITITATSSTDKIKILDVNDNEKMIAEANTYIDSNGSRMFSVPWTPNTTKSIFKTLKVVPGNNSAYNESPNAYKIFAVSISADLSPKIISFESDKTKVNRDDKIKITIETNSNVDMIKISTKDKDKLLQITNYKVEDIDNPTTRIFEASLTMENRGEIELMAYAGKDNEYSKDYKSITISVGGTGSVVDKDEKSLSINDVYVLNNGLYSDEDAKVVIKTSSDIKKIKILNDDDKEVNSTRYPTIKRSSEYVWDLNVTVPESGRNRFSVVAYNDDDKTTKYNFDINAYSYSSGDLHILNIVQDDIGALIGDDIKFTIRTTSKADKIKIFDGNKEILEETSYRNDGSIKEFTVKIKVDSSNKDTLKAVAYDSDNKEIDQKINPYLSSNTLGKIYEHNLITPEVNLGDDIKIELYTNKSVEKVWIEDDNGTSMDRKMSYDNVSGDEYTWKLRFPAEETGNNVRYTIFAKDENGETHEQTFRVRVRK